MAKRDLRVGASLLDSRQIEGYLSVWGVVDSYGTKLIKGSFAKSILERGPGTNSKVQIKFLWQHDPCDPLSLFETLEEDNYGLFFRTKPLDNVASADRALVQYGSKTLDNFSAGFFPVWDKAAYDDTDDSIVFTEAALVEGSIVTFPSNEETYGIRQAHSTTGIDELANIFLDKIPVSMQVEARQLIQRYKSLATRQPADWPLPVSKPSKNVIDFDFLTKNFKLK